MISSPDEYLLVLQQESARSLGHYNFSDWQPRRTETVEFHLLHHCLTTLDGQDTHLALDANSNDPTFLSSLLDTIVLAKYHQNYIDSQAQAAAQVRPGDMLFHKGALLCCAEVYPDGKWTVREAFRKNALPYSSPIKKAILLQRKETYAYKPRKTADQLLAYRDYFRQVLNEPKLDVLSRFSHKTLIIGNDDLLTGQPAYPVRYWSRTGTVRAHGLPIDTMVEACGTVDTALNHILTGGTYFDEVIVVGSERYKKAGLLDNLRNEKNLGSFGKLILIGNQNPDLGSQLVKRWRWVMSELRHLNDRPDTVFLFTKLPVPALAGLVINLRQQLRALQEQARVDASELLLFLRFYYRLFLPDGPRREAIVRDFHTRLELHLRGDELLDKFAVAGHHDPEDVDNRLVPLRENLIEIRDYFLANNPKYTTYLNNSVEGSSRLEVVVLPNARHASEVTMRERGHLITYDGQVRHNLTDIRTWSRSALNENLGRIYYVPGWFGLDSLLQVQRLAGQVRFLLFDGVETADFTRDWDRVGLHQKGWQQHPDRNYWFGACPPLLTSTGELAPPREALLMPELIEIDEPQQPAEVLEEKAPKYRLHFTDGTTDDFYGYKSVWLLNGQQKTAVTVSELYTTARVQFYQNANSKTFNQIIQQLAGPERSKRIDTHSQCWRGYCQQLLAYYHNDFEQLHSKLCRNGMTSLQASLRSFQLPSSTIRFPQKRTMNALHKLGTAIGMNNHLFITDYKALMASRRWDRNLRHSTGRQLSDELMHFDLTGTKGALLSQLSDDMVYALIQSIQEKTIATITLSTLDHAH